MSTPYVDRLISSMMDKLRQKMAEVGSRITDDLSARCSNPYPPASDPGEPPHTRSGDYMGGWFAEVTTLGRDEFELFVTNHQTSKLQWLERGTLHAAARPVVDEVQKTWDPWIRRLLVEAVNEVRD